MRLIRAAGWESTVESFFTDLRYAGRMLRKSPVFSIVTILVVALVSSYLPARRAAASDPMTVLRTD